MLYNKTILKSAGSRHVFFNIYFAVIIFIRHFEYNSKKKVKYFWPCINCVYTCSGQKKWMNDFLPRGIYLPTIYINVFVKILNTSSSSSSMDSFDMQPLYSIINEWKKLTHSIQIIHIHFSIHIIIINIYYYILKFTIKMEEKKFDY